MGTSTGACYWFLALNTFQAFVCLLGFVSSDDDVFLVAMVNHIFFFLRHFESVATQPIRLARESAQRAQSAPL